MLTVLWYRWLKRNAQNFKRRSLSHALRQEFFFLGVLRQDFLLGFSFPLSTRILLSTFAEGWESYIVLLVALFLFDDLLSISFVTFV